MVHGGCGARWTWTHGAKLMLCKVDMVQVDVVQDGHSRCTARWTWCKVDVVQGRHGAKLTQCKVNVAQGG